FPSLKCFTNLLTLLAPMQASPNFLGGKSLNTSTNRNGMKNHMNCGKSLKSQQKYQVSMKILKISKLDCILKETASNILMETVSCILKGCLPKTTLENAGIQSLAKHRGKTALEAMLQKKATM
ncbi:hypothetical protein L9F63_020353, partial [Diploptera punctata]